MDAYLGVDISAGKWAGVLLGDSGAVSLVADRIEELVIAARAIEEPGVIAIDIPINPPVRGTRLADTSARAMLRGRSPTLFTCPSSAALEVARQRGFAPDGYTDAVAANLEAQGIGMSRQAYALAKKIVDVHDWLAAGGSAGADVIECHPEVSFAHLVNTREPVPLRHGKKTWEGLRHRLQMLRGAGIDVMHVKDETGLIGTDDVVDAAAAVWTARRFAAGNAVRYPAQEADGDTAAIWA